MNQLPHNEELLAVARRVVWFKEPDETLDQQTYFLAHVMTFGTPCDLRAIKPYTNDQDMKETLLNAPAGVFDARSWAYWSLLLGEKKALLPERSFKSDGLS